MATPDIADTIGAFEHLKSLTTAQLVAAVSKADYPTEGPIAEALWHLLSSYKSRYSPAEAAWVYRELGYEPFSGYPLKRKVTDESAKGGQHASPNPFDLSNV